MEARRIARKIQAAQDTLASLRAEQNDVSGKNEIVSKALAGNDRGEKGNTPEPEIATGKSLATLDPRSERPSTNLEHRQ